MRNEKVFICVCPYCQTVTLTVASHNQSKKEISFHCSATLYVERSTEILKG
jgi:hypothetical protein